MIVVATAVVVMSIGLCINLFILCRMFVLLLDWFVIIFIALAEYILIRLLLAVVGG
jgi:hypothetical protein